MAMTMAAESSPDPDAAAYRLLGWPFSEGNDTQDYAAIAANVNRDEITRMHAEVEVRNTVEGATNFRRAMQILLSGDKGRIVFHETPEEDHRLEGGSNDCRHNDPLSIIEGYFRLIKLSLESPPSAAAAATSSKVLSGEELLRMACELLKHLGDSLKKAIQNQILHLSSSQQSSIAHFSAPSANLAVKRPSQNGNAAVLRYFQSIQTIHPHVRLLGPAYRSFCDVADSFLSLLDAQQSRMDRFVMAFLPSLGWEALFAGRLQKDAEELSNVRKECIGLFERTSRHLLGVMDGCLDKFHKAMEKTSPSSPLPSPEKQSKVLVFLFARVTSLILMTLRCQESLTSKMVNGKGSLKDDNNEGGRKMVTGFLQRLTQACRLSLVAQSRLQEDAGKSIRNALVVVVGLRPKAEQYLSKIFCDFDSKSANAIGLGLDCFMELPDLNETDSYQDSGLAKLLLMKYVTRKLYETKSVFYAESSTMVKFYRAFLLEVPKCYHFFQPSPVGTLGCNLHNQARHVLSDLVGVLENASHMLCYPKKTGGQDDCWQQAIIQQHYLLLQWLAPAYTNYSSPKLPTPPNHPMTKEILLRVLQNRIQVSCSIEDQYSQQDANHLVSLLAQLLFHNQTETSHRRNIATLLIRLLSSSSSNTNKSNKQNETTTLTIRCLWDSMKKANIINATQRKRKRGRGGMSDRAFLPEDVHTICWVLEALAKTSIRSRTSIASDISAEMMQFFKSPVNKNFSNGNKNGNIFLVSLAVGATRAGSNLENIFLWLNDVAASKKVSPNGLIEGILAFIELQLGTKSGNAMRRLIMQSVCIQLIGALSQYPGLEMSEAQVNRVGNILKKAVVSNSAISSVQAIRLQYDIVCVASKMGRVVRQEFGESSLQPLIESINHTLVKSSWYFIAPSITSLEHFVKALPSHFKVQVSKTLPASGRMLLTSRLQGKLFSTVAEKAIDPITDAAYSATQECRFLRAYCNCKPAEDALFTIGEKSIIMKSGSNAFVHSDEDGNTVAIVIIPSDRKVKSSTELLSAIRTFKCDIHSVSSNCELRIDPLQGSLEMK